MLSLSLSLSLMEWKGERYLENIRGLADNLLLVVVMSISKVTLNGQSEKIHEDLIERSEMVAITDVKNGWSVVSALRARKLPFKQAILIGECKGTSIANGTHIFTLPQEHGQI